MRISTCHTTRYLVTAFAVIALVPVVAFAADGPVGEWNVLVNANGQESPSTLTIVEEGGRYSGTAASDQGVTELSEISYEDGTLSFTIELPEAGISIAFAGTIDGDSLQGRFEIPDMGVELPATGARKGGTSAIVGTWKLMVESQLGNNPRELVVHPDMSGTYGGGSFAHFPISNVKIDGNNVQFDVTLSFQGQDLPCHGTLTLDGNSIGGELDYGMGASTIVGEKADNPIVGSWAMSGNSDIAGPIERTWVFNDDRTGKYTGDIGSFDIANVALKGNAVSFEVTLEAQGQQLPASFEGTLEGGVLSGDLDYGFGSVTMKGTKQAN